jgi:hypothetical protein
MPRSVDSDNRGPATAIVRGQQYDRPTQWQQLVLRDVPKLLAAEVRAMRTIPGTKIDPREAFVDAIVLVLPGDSRGVEVRTTDLVVDGVLRPDSPETPAVNLSSSQHSSKVANSPHAVGDSVDTSTGRHSTSS